MNTLLMRLVPHFLIHNQPLQVSVTLYLSSTVYNWYVLCSVLITATDISHDPSKLVFFNNYEDGELGKGQYVLYIDSCTVHLMMMCLMQLYRIKTFCLTL